MIRSRRLIAALDDAALRRMATLWRCSADADALEAAMRADDTLALVKKACDSPVMLEDLLLLAANPFDPVEADELADPARFVEWGLVAAADGGFVVNTDLALTAVRTSPIEFGFAGTLLARLPEDQRTIAARAMQIGARPTAVDTVLDTASATQDRDRLIAHVARLSDFEREVLREALGLGELPDDLSTMRLDAKPATVQLHPGPAGQRGLVFRVACPAARVEERLVVPLELAGLLPDVLEQVPPPPEPIAAKARRRPASGATRRTPRPKPEPVDDPMAQSGAGESLRAAGSGASRRLDPLAGSGASRRLDPPAGSGAFGRMDPMAGSGASRRLDPLAGSGAFGRMDPMAGSGPDSPFRVGRVTAVEDASGVIDLDTARIAAAALEDEVLAPDIVRVVSDALVVLRAGVDPKEWAERCAQRLGL